MACCRDGLRPTPHSLSPGASIFTSTHSQLRHNSPPSSANPLMASSKSFTHLRTPASHHHLNYLVVYLFATQHPQRHAMTYYMTFLFPYPQLIGQGYQATAASSLRYTLFCSSSTLLFSGKYTFHSPNSTTPIPRQTDHRSTISLAFILIPPRLTEVPTLLTDYVPHSSYGKGNVTTTPTHTNYYTHPFAAPMH